MDVVPFCLVTFDDKNLKRSNRFVMHKQQRLCLSFILEPSLPLCVEYALVKGVEPDFSVPVRSDNMW